MEPSLEDLPEELLHIIIKHLDVPGKRNLRQTSSRWHDLVEENIDKLQPCRLSRELDLEGRFQNVTVLNLRYVAPGPFYTAFTLVLPHLRELYGCQILHCIPKVILSRLHTVQYEGAYSDCSISSNGYRLLEHDGLALCANLKKLELGPWNDSPFKLSKLNATDVEQIYINDSHITVLAENFGLEWPARYSPTEINGRTSSLVCLKLCLHSEFPLADVDFCCLDNLQELWLSGVGPHGYNQHCPHQFLNRLTTLTRLSLGETSGLAISCLTLLTGLTRLQSFRMQDAYLSGKTHHIRRAFPNLLQLDVDHCRQLTEREFPVWLRLTSLKLVGCNLTSLQPLTQMTQLKRLAIDYQISLVHCLGDIRGLEHATLANVEHNEEDDLCWLRSLYTLQNLRTVYVCGVAWSSHSQHYMMHANAQSESHRKSVVSHRERQEIAKPGCHLAQSEYEHHQQVSLEPDIWKAFDACYCAHPECTTQKYLPVWVSPNYLGTTK